MSGSQTIQARQKALAKAAQAGVLLWMLVLPASPSAAECRDIGLGLLPDGWTDQGGGVIDDEYSLIASCQGPKRRLSLMRSIGTRKNKTQEAIASLSWPALAKGELLVFGAYPCRIRGKPDPEIFAIAKDTDEEFHTVIRRAWRASRKDGRFHEIPVAGITCENRGYGL